jgi:predicted AlkP superfamily pyrophosphatase or phosphodiesterase
MLLQFCSELVLHEQLGADAVPDVLFMSLSASDAIGHSFGPDSHEIQDYYLRLDKYLLPFLKMLDANVGAGKYLFVLTADHGVCPLPEVEAARGNTAARRIRSDIYQSDVRNAIARAFPNCQKPESLIAFLGPSIIINEPYAAACSLQTELTRFRIAAAVQRVGYVADVFTLDQLASDTADFRPCAQQFKNGFRADRSPDLFVNFYEWVLVTGSSFGTSHGTPYHYDTDVPLVFFGDGVEAEIYESQARTVDIAPTVTALLGFTSPSDLDGQVLRMAR